MAVVTCVARVELHFTRPQTEELRRKIYNGLHEGMLEISFVKTLTHNNIDYDLPDATYLYIEDINVTVATLTEILQKIKEAVRKSLKPFQGKEGAMIDFTVILSGLNKFTTHNLQKSETK